MSTSLLVAAPSAPAGRISVRDRVIEKIVHRASADAIGVESGEVKVEVSEWRGGYAVRVRTPLPIPDLDDTEAIASGSSVIERVTALQQQLKGHLAHVTGRDITRLAVVVTGAVVPPRRRVR